MTRIRERLATAWENLRASFSGGLSAREVFLAVFVGTFIGALPVFGLHILTCLALARVFRLNAVLTTLATNVSNPLTAPLLLAAEVYVGDRILGNAGDALVFPSSGAEVLAMVRDGGHLLWACSIGSLVVGLGVGLVLGGLAAGLAAWRSRARAGGGAVGGSVSPAPPAPGG